MAANDDTAELQRFRDAWKRDLQERHTSALRLYNEALVLEADGMINEAIQSYRRAFKLDPDVEKALRNAPRASTQPATPQPTTPQPAIATAAVPPAGHASSQPRPEPDAPVAVVVPARIHADPVLQALADVDTTMRPRDEAQDAAILRLPDELVLAIFTAVAEQSVAGLARLSKVCRRWYVLTQEPVIWRRLCELAWPQAEFQLGFFKSDWKLMYTDRPRLRTDGAYIAKVTYLRQGESDTYYQPVHLVTYYRYLRFQPSGTVYSLLTSDAPAAVVSHLREGKDAAKGLMVGAYVTREHLDDPRPYVGVKLWMRAPSGSQARYTYVMHLRLRSTIPGASNKLSLASYYSFDHGLYGAAWGVIGDADDADDADAAAVPAHVRTVYDVSAAKPFTFSRVRSYAAAAGLM